MLLYGASGHAKVICTCLESQNIPIEGIFDDYKTIDKLYKYKLLGAYDPRQLPNSEIIISIGDNGIRRTIASEVKHPYGKVIHKEATIASTVIIGLGTVCMQNSTIQIDTVIGSHCIINTASSIDHDCILEDYVHIAPNTTLCGNIKIGEGTLVGSGAVAIPNISIGKWARIGAGSVIIHDIPDYAVVVGNPGKITKYNHAK